MFDTKIEICQELRVKNALNERLKQVAPIFSTWAQKTEFGGRENMYASRIVNENEIIFTIRHKEVMPSRWVYDGKRVYKIISVHTEGRRWRTHIKVQASDTNDMSYVEHRD